MSQKKSSEIEERMEENKVIRLKKYFIPIVMFLSTIIVVFLGSYIKGCNNVSIVRNTIMSGISVGIVLFLMEQTSIYSCYDYDNDKHTYRFIVCYFIGLLLAVFCGFFPVSGWPYIAIFLLLTLFSNTLLGICTSFVFLMISLFISGASVDIFCLYGISGIACSCFFRKLDDSYKVIIPFFLSIMVLTLSLTANIVLFTNEKLGIELFFIPILNLFVSGLLLLIILKVFSTLVIFKYRNWYMEMNAPECELLVQLKDLSKEDYYKAVHTAYFCDRIAKKLSLDSEALKTCGYYHNIGIIKENKDLNAMNEIMENYNFPQPVIDILMDYLSKDKKIVKKETAVLLFADSIITAINYILSKDKNIKLDYDQIIETVFRKKMESEILSECNITLLDLRKMENCFKEEKLYYDFLR